MKSGKTTGSVICAIIIESILFIEVAVELYTGEKSLADLGIIFTLCLLLVIPFVMIMRRKRKNMYSTPSDQALNNSEADDSKQD